MCRVWPAMPSDSPAVFVFVLLEPTFRLMRGHIVGPAVRCLYGCWAQPSGLLCLAGGSVTGAWVQILRSGLNHGNFCHSWNCVQMAGADPGMTGLKPAYVLRSVSVSSLASNGSDRSTVTGGLCFRIRSLNYIRGVFPYVSPSARAFICVLR